MRAIDELKSEHVILERVLAALDVAAVGAAHLKPVRPGFFVDTYGFVLDFTEGFHFKKEEEILFKIMESNGIPTENSEMGTLLSDHEQSRRYIRAMLAAAKEWDGGDIQARAEVIWATSGYTGLLHQHIARENTIFFSLVKQTLTPEELEQVAVAFDQMNQASEENIHYKYTKIAIDLEKEANTWR
jgi:hemerythrin-like domain-containing protein